MKRSFLYMLVLAVILVLPARSTDVGKLRPVQTVAVYRNQESCIIKTDTEDIGNGTTIIEALEDLKSTTPAVLYLDTAQYLLVNDKTLIEELRPYLKRSVCLYGFIGDPPMETVSKYLSAQPDSVKLGKWKDGEIVPVLDCTKDRIKMLK